MTATLNLDSTEQSFVPIYVPALSGGPHGGIIFYHDALSLVCVDDFTFILNGNAGFCPPLLKDCSSKITPLLIADVLYCERPLETDFLIQEGSKTRRYFGMGKRSGDGGWAVAAAQCLLTNGVIKAQTKGTSLDEPLTVMDCVRDLPKLPAQSSVCGKMLMVWPYG